MVRMKCCYAKSFWHSNRQVEWINEQMGSGCLILSRFHRTFHHFQFVSVSVVCELVNLEFFLLFVGCISISLAFSFPLFDSMMSIVFATRQLCWLSFQLDWKAWIYCFYSQTFKNLLLHFQWIGCKMCAQFMRSASTCNYACFLCVIKMCALVVTKFWFRFYCLLFNCQNLFTFHLKGILNTAHTHTRIMQTDQFYKWLGLSTIQHHFLSLDFTHAK